MRKKRRKESEEFDPLDWLSKRLETLRMDKYIKEIEKNFSKDDLYKAHLWTPLKLIALMWWLTIYSRIVQNTSLTTGILTYWHLLELMSLKKLETLS